MPRAKQKLGQKLRSLILATPLIAELACGGANEEPGPQNDDYGIGLFPPACYENHPSTKEAYGTVTFALQATDGGQYDCRSACERYIPCASWVSIDTCWFDSSWEFGPRVSCTGTIQCGCFGRRPASLSASSARPRSPSAVGTFFAEATRLEAASVPAFRILSRELAAHEAPRQLVRAALRSAEDEIRHTRSMAALARRYGATPTRPRLAPAPAGRSLEAIASENAIEGCVRETYGALQALWQAKVARDPVVARTMARIADDEIRHAELAWEVASWAETRLGRAARHRIDAARSQALDALRDELSQPVARSLVELAGVPHVAHASNLLLGLDGALGTAGSA